MWSPLQKWGGVKSRILDCSCRDKSGKKKKKQMKNYCRKMANSSLKKKALTAGIQSKCCRERSSSLSCIESLHAYSSQPVWMLMTEVDHNPTKARTYESYEFYTLQHYDTYSMSCVRVFTDINTAGSKFCQFRAFLYAVVAALY